MPVLLIAYAKWKIFQCIANMRAYLKQLMCAFFLLYMYLNLSKKACVNFNNNLTQFGPDFLPMCAHVQKSYCVFR